MRSIIIRLSVLFFYLFSTLGFATQWKGTEGYRSIEKILIDEARGIVPPDVLIRSVEDHSRYYEKSVNLILTNLKTKETSIQARYIYAFAFLEMIKIRQQREEKTSTLKKQLDFLDEYLNRLKKESAKSANDDTRLQSEIYRLLADVKNSLAPFYGLKEMLILYQKSVAYLEKSIVLHKKNPRTVKSLALSYYFKPRIAGGSVKQSIRLLNEALSYAKNDSLVSYEVYIWLANAYSRANKKEEATTAIKKALAIYPAGGFANHVLGIIENGKYIK